MAKAPVTTPQPESPSAPVPRKSGRGVVIGLILIQLLKNGLLLAGVKGDATIVVIGSVLILSILVNNVIQRRRG